MNKPIIKNTRYLSLGLTFLAAAITSQAAVIDFTPDDYADGNLKGQGGSATWDYSGASAAYVVDADGSGSVTSDPNAGYAPAARYTDAISLVAGQTVTLSMDFQFIGLDLTDSATNSFFSLGLSDAAGSLKAYSSIGHPNWSSLPENQQYYFQYTQGNTGTPATKLDDSASKLGLTDAGGTLSDHLRMSVALTVASSGLSTYTASLYNLDDSEMVYETTTASANLDAYTELFLAFRDGSTPMTVSQISYSVVPEPSAYALLLGGLVGIAAFTRRSRKA